VLLPEWELALNKLRVGIGVCAGVCASLRAQVAVFKLRWSSWDVNMGLITLGWNVVSIL
jgi:hypothetical protein